MARSPVWKSIATQIEADIAAGHYRAGDKLPTEAELSARFGVNRHTVRRALSDMSARDLVRSRRGAGVFVEAPPTEYPIGKRTRFHQAVEATGKLPTKRALRIERRRCDATEAKALQLDIASDVIVYEGISLSQDVPIAHFISIFDAARFPGLEETFKETTSITKALRQHGVSDYLRSETRLSVDRPSATQALNLHLREGDMLMKTVSLNTDPNGQPLEYGQTWFVADRVTLVVKNTG